MRQDLEDPSLVDAVVDVNDPVPKADDGREPRYRSR